MVLWTANTERYSAVSEGLNDTAETLMASIERNEAEVSPSTIYAAACVLEGVPFINGSPQNTFVPGAWPAGAAPAAPQQLRCPARTTAEVRRPRADPPALKSAHSVPLGPP